MSSLYKLAGIAPAVDQYLYGQSMRAQFDEEARNELLWQQGGPAALQRGFLFPGDVDDPRARAALQEQFDVAESKRQTSLGRRDLRDFMSQQESTLGRLDPDNPLTAKLQDSLIRMRAALEGGQTKAGFQIGELETLQRQQAREEAQTQGEIELKEKRRLQGKAEREHDVDRAEQQRLRKQTEHVRALQQAVEEMEGEAGEDVTAKLRTELKALQQAKAAAGFAGVDLSALGDPDELIRDREDALAVAEAEAEAGKGPAAVRLAARRAQRGAEERRRGASDEKINTGVRRFLTLRDRLAKETERLDERGELTEERAKSLERRLLLAYQAELPGVQRRLKEFGEGVEAPGAAPAKTGGVLQASPAGPERLAEAGAASAGQERVQLAQAALKESGVALATLRAETVAEATRGIGRKTGREADRVAGLLASIQDTVERSPAGKVPTADLPITLSSLWKQIRAIAGKAKTPEAQRKIAAGILALLINDIVTNPPR